MQKITKIKTKLMITTLAVVMLLLGGIVSLTLIGGTTIQAQASSSTRLNPSTHAELEYRMNRNYFFHEGTRFYIHQYYTHLFGNRGRPDNSPRVRMPGRIDGETTANGVFVFTDPITSLIPVQVFQELTTTGVHTFMGKEWGVIIDVEVSPNRRSFFVQVIDIIVLDSTNIREEQNVSIEIRPMFEVHLAWLSAGSNMNFNGFVYTRSGPEGLYAIPQVQGTWVNNQIFLETGVFAQSRRNYLANFAFAGVLSNEQNANPGHYGFDPTQDFGHYFFETNLLFNATNIQQSTTERRWYDSSNTTVAAMRAFAGFLPIPGIDIALLAWGIADIARDLRQDSNNLPIVANFNNNNSLRERFWIPHWRQINHPDHPDLPGYGQLLKSVATLPANSSLALTNQTTYIRGEFGIIHQIDGQGNTWISRFNTSFIFDVRRHSSHNTVATARGQRTMLLGNTRANYREVTLGQPIRVYNHNQNTSRFRFTAPTTGHFRFDLVDPSHRAWFRDFTPQEIRMQAGQTRYFSLEYSRTGASISYLTVEFLDTLIFTPIGASGAEVRLGPGAAYLRFLNIPRTVMIDGRLRDVTHVGVGAFEGTYLDRIELPDSITHIGERAFAHTAILGFTIPRSVMYIGANAFEGSQAMIYAQAYRPQPGWDESWNSSNRHVHFGVVGTFARINGMYFAIVGSFVVLTRGGWSSEIPRTVPLGGRDLAVDTIGRYAFYNSSLTSVRMPDTVSRIESFAFRHSRLTDIRIPSSVWSIGSRAFADTPNLRSVIFESGSILNRIESHAFARSGLMYINIPHRVREIGDYAFAGTRDLIEVRFEQGSQLQTIWSGVFEGSGLMRIQIPSSVWGIGAFAFAYTNRLSSVTFEQGNRLVEIRNFAFEGSAIRHIQIPSGVTFIGNNAFAYSHLESITFEGNSITRIGNFAFEGARLRGIVIPSSVTEIGNFAFAYNRNLTSVTFVPDSRLVTIGNHAFEGTGITGIIIPNRVTHIGNSAFANSSLTSVEFEDNSSLISIGNHAFFSVNINGITLPKTLQTIGDWAFARTNFQWGSIIIPNSVVTIGSFAFYNNRYLRSVFIPDSVLTIGASAFSNCPNLTIAVQRLHSPSGWEFNWHGSRPIIWGAISPHSLYL